MHLTFEINSGEVVVSDPCYDVKNMDQGCIKGKAQNGIWIAVIDIEYLGGWGKRVVSAHVYTVPSSLPVNNLEAHKLYVDSGQMSVFDAASYVGRENEDVYYAICNLTCDMDSKGGERFAGVYENVGVAMSTGYGDGSYTCEAEKNENGEYVSFYFTFVEDEEYNEGEPEDKEEYNEYN